ncbi:bifunctional 4-hydroxy-2-oxoglutarate aldolase/2-dehydro-3-deoxy-phosphogluconate aldolase [Virgibacillus dakarensis]|nr:bifunctional 4-hydroxy-2-oxoglutarate aldolase/2-dehydro-3-deoxy-phosphogluconate aldolase [Virgibacillus dakarensis]
MSIDRLTKSGVIAVVRKLEPTKTLHVIEALIKGGITGLEITINSEDALHLINKAKKEFGSDAVVGAGTVLDGSSAGDAIRAGAEFVFAPTLSKETILVGNRYGKIVIPGVMTPTEMLQAYEWGAEAVKIFPASVLGPKFIKDVKGPLGHIPIVPTGGINLENVQEYISVGAIAVGVGGSLLKKQFIQDNKWEALTDLAKQFKEKVNEARAYAL